MEKNLSALSRQPCCSNLQVSIVSAAQLLVAISGTSDLSGLELWCGRTEESVLSTFSMNKRFKGS